MIKNSTRTRWHRLAQSLSTKRGRGRVKRSWQTAVNYGVNKGYVMRLSEYTACGRVNRFRQTRNQASDKRKQFNRELPNGKDATTLQHEAFLRCVAPTVRHPEVGKQSHLGCAGASR